MTTSTSATTTVATTSTSAPKHFYYVFQVSRLKNKSTYKGRTLRLAEYLNKRTEEVVALATMHLDQHLFLFGLPLAYVSNGKKCYSKNSKLGGITNYNFQLQEKHLKALDRQIEKLEKKQILTKPPCKANGVSLLRDYQLIIKVREDHGIDVRQDEKGTTIYVAATEIIAMNIVSKTSGSEYFIPPDPDQVSVNGDLFHTTSHEVVEGNSNKLETAEEILAFLEKGKAKVMAAHVGQSRENKRRATARLNKAIKEVTDSLTQGKTQVDIDLSEFSEPIF